MSTRSTCHHNVEITAFVEVTAFSDFVEDRRWVARHHEHGRGERDEFAGGT